MESGSNGPGPGSEIRPQQARSPENAYNQGKKPVMLNLNQSFQTYGTPELIEIHFVLDSLNVTFGKKMEKGHI